MALIHCPECDKEISDQSESCPNCGYVLVKNELHKIRKSELSPVESDPSSGILRIVCGAILIPLSLFGCIIVLPFGIIGVVAAMFLIVSGIEQMRSTRQKGLCPYCGNPIEVTIGGTICKCPHCKKTSTIKENQLETIE